MKKTLLLLSAVVFAGMTASAQQVDITNGTGLIYNQDFNGLDSATTQTTGGTTLPNGWSIAEVYTGTSTPTNDNKYRAGNGSTNNGDTYSYGTAGLADRAMGSLASNSLYSTFGVKFRNTTGGTLQSATVSYKMEQWRVGDTASRPDTTLFEYSTTATGIDDTTSANWTDVPALMMSSIVTVASNNSGNSLDGNLPINSRLMTATITLNVPNNGNLYFRLKDKNIIGSDDGLAIDDMNVVFTTAQGVSNTAANNLPLTLLGNGVVNDVKATFTAPENGAYTVTVTDLAGRVVAATENTAAKGETVVLPVANTALATGMYLVRVAQGSFAGTAKLSVR